MKRLIAPLVFLLLPGCGGDSSDSDLAEPPDSLPEVRLEVAYPSLPAFNQPVGMVHDADGDRWYVIEREGRVLVFDDDPDVSDFDVALDISSVVISGPTEAGLLGIALHPDFATNRQVFLSYTRAGLVSHISRFTASFDGSTLIRLSEQEVLTIAQDFDNHNGGHLVFGLDGFLYAGFGDGGDSDDPLNRAQDTTNLLGSIIRIDVDGGTPYVIPEENVFAGNPVCTQGFGSADCPELFAWGLRNPWRWSFDTQTGALWAGDVGQDRFEEIDMVESGNNYGWRIREGANCNIPDERCRTAGLIDPVFEYDHSLGEAVTGGFVYRGNDFPDLEGVYLFGDFVSGRLWGLFEDSDGDFSAEVLVDDTGLSIVSFAEDTDLELYLLDYAAGLVYRVRTD